MPKRYFIVKDKYKAILPPEFSNSQANRGERWIQVRQVKVMINKALVGDVELHSDLIKRDFDCDHFVMYSNEQVPGLPMKYEWNSLDQEINFWFTDMKGNRIQPENFTIVMLLCY